MSKEVLILVDKEMCNGCKRCVDACPSRLFVYGAEKKATPLADLYGCTRCGHCVALCRQGAIRHSAFSAEKVKPIDYGAYPTPAQLMLLLKARRSNRLFSATPIEKGHLELIIEAATAAPTASNSRSVSYTLITNPKVLQEISDHTINAIIRLTNIVGHPLVKWWLKPLAPQLFRYQKLLDRMLMEREQGYDLILRGATSLLLIHAPQKSRFAVEDCNLAYQNASLMAEVLGVNHFYTGFIIAVLRMRGGNRILRQLGIEGKVCAGLAMGKAAYRYPKYVERETAEVHHL